MTPELREWYRGKRVFVTGHTGFKGAWLTAWLRSAGADVVGYALAPPDDRPSLFTVADVGTGVESVIADVRDRAALERALRESAPELVFHLAAQSLVRRSYREPAATYEANVMGTVNVLDLARDVPSIGGIVVVTSDKCYENRGVAHAYREDEPLGGSDPYSSSKGCAELVTSAMRRSFFQNGAAVASVRAGNVIGGGDWAEDRLVPDVMSAASAGTPVTVRHPDATRPWQFVLEPLRGYLLLGRALIERGHEFAEAWNFGPEETDAVSVGDVVRRLHAAWPLVDARLAEHADGPHEASTLQLDSTKSRTRLGWKPALSLDDAVDLTAAWYRAFHEEPAAAPSLVSNQLQEYEARVAAGSAHIQVDERIRVPYGQTVHGEEEVAAVTRVLRTSTQMGVNVREFESRIAALFAKPHGIMVNSGSSANYLAVQLLGLSAGSEVITPALTFATTVAPLVRFGLVPAFVDVEADTFNIDVEQIEAAITPQTRAMMIPSLIGNLPDWDRIAELARAHDLVVIEDSADTLGATLRGTSTGTRSDISTTSFYGSHVINCAGNGGMLCVNREDLLEEAKLLRSWGRSSSLFVESEEIENRFNVDVGGIPYDAKFVFSRVGYNVEPSELGAAFGLVQLDRLEGNISVRERNFERQLTFFRDYEDWFILPRQLPDTRTGWLAFPLIVRDDAPFRRRDLQIHLERQNIQTRTVFTGNVLRQPGFAGIERRESAGGYPNADAVMRGGMLLGCHHGLDDRQLDYVHEQFRTFAASFR